MSNTYSMLYLQIEFFVILNALCIMWDILRKIYSMGNNRKDRRLKSFLLEIQSVRFIENKKILQTCCFNLAKNCEISINSNMHKVRHHSLLGTLLYLISNGKPIMCTNLIVLVLKLINFKRFYI